MSESKKSETIDILRGWVESDDLDISSELMEKVDALYKDAPRDWENIKHQLAEGPSTARKSSYCEDWCVQDGRKCSCAPTSKWLRDMIKEILELCEKHDLTPEIIDWILNLDPSDFVADYREYSELDMGDVYRALLVSNSLSDGYMATVWEQGNDAGAFDFADAQFRSNILVYSHNHAFLASALRADLSTEVDKVLAGDERHDVIFNVILLVDEPTVELLELLAEILTPQDDPDMCINNMEANGWMSLDEQKVQVVIDRLRG